MTSPGSDPLTLAANALRDIMAHVPAHLHSTVEEYRNQARAYVWGRQDAGEGEHDTAVSLLFSYVYAHHAARYLIGAGFRHNLKDAFTIWQRGEDINGRL